MRMEHYSQFFPAICAGLGLFLAGGAYLVFLNRGVALRAVATGAALGIALVAAARLEAAETLRNTVRLLALVMIPFVLLGSGQLTLALMTTIAAMSRPVVRAALLTAGGIGLAIGSVVVFERTENRIFNEIEAESALFHAQVPANPSTREKAVTDRGTPIEIRESTAPRAAEVVDDLESRFLSAGSFRDRVIRVGRADERSNCHGWVFTGGRYVLRGVDVEVILNENNYYQESIPLPGDLVIYRGTPGGSITHTAVVQCATDDEPVLVRSKWGSLGIFTHVVDQSPYGAVFSYHRSTRGGHRIIISPISSGHSVPSTSAE
jgi:hypothetical protein